MNRQPHILAWLFGPALLLLMASTALAQQCNTAMPRSAPDERYQNHGEDVVIDLWTGLMWQRCSLGQSGPDCAGNATGYTWDQALQQAEAINSSGGLAGYTDWRLPNIKELLSLLERACSPSINLGVFPNTAADIDYWSSSPKVMANDDTFAWSVYFDRFSFFTGQRSYPAAVRLVRGGQ